MGRTCLTMCQRVPCVVSACLLGLPCRYDGRSNFFPLAARLVEARLAYPLCPEGLGGLPIPRLPCERVGKRVLCRDGRDFTCAFQLGAQKAYRQSLALGARYALLKSRSPSCGIGQIYDGRFRKKLIPGYGLWAEALLQRGFILFSEDELAECPDISTFFGLCRQREHLGR